MLLIVEAKGHDRRQPFDQRGSPYLVHGDVREQSLLEAPVECKCVDFHAVFGIAEAGVIVATKVSLAEFVQALTAIVVLANVYKFMGQLDQLIYHFVVHRIGVWRVPFPDVNPVAERLGDRAGLEVETQNIDAGDQVRPVHDTDRIHERSKVRSQPVLPILIELLQRPVQVVRRNDFGCGYIGGRTQMSECLSLEVSAMLENWLIGTIDETQSNMDIFLSFHWICEAPTPDDRS